MTTRVSRSLVLAGAVASMVYGIWLGLLRLGWILPLPWPDQLILHGPLMVGGFVGTLIGLERAIGSGRRWAYFAPVCTVAGVLVLVFGPPTSAGPVLMTAGSVLVVLLFVVLLGQHFSMSTFALLAGALCWCVGNVGWMGGAGIYRVVFWWIGFVVLTIGGERLELNRVLRPSARVRAAFGGAAALMIAGALAMAVDPGAGKGWLGAGLIGTAAWLLMFDVARRTVRQPGLTRYIATCLLAGYVWLVVAGLLLFTSDVTAPGARYDAVLHSIFVGFVVSMIFGHAPIVFPAVLHRALPYRRIVYLPLVLLHVSVAMRLTGDLVDELGRLRAWGGLWNAAAIGLFLATTAGSLQSFRAAR
ncbi:MAG TPA: hypothetical protein VF456_17080 [Vicinamibacterales bacterium]